MRWRIETEDRIGMIHDCLEVFYNNKVNIDVMEVKPKEIYLKFKATDIAALKDKLLQNQDIKGVTEVSLLPVEKKKNNWWKFWKLSVREYWPLTKMGR